MTHNIFGKVLYTETSTLQQLHWNQLTSAIKQQTGTGHNYILAHCLVMSAPTGDWGSWVRFHFKICIKWLLHCGYTLQTATFLALVLEEECCQRGSKDCIIYFIFRHKVFKDIHPHLLYSLAGHSFNTKHNRLNQLCWAPPPLCSNRSLESMLSEFSTQVHMHYDYCCAHLVARDKVPSCKLGCFMSRALWNIKHVAQLRVLQL